MAWFLCNTLHMIMHEKIKECAVTEGCIHSSSCESWAKALQEVDYKEVLHLTAQACEDLIPWDLFHAAAVLCAVVILFCTKFLMTSFSLYPIPRSHSSSQLNGFEYFALSQWSVIPSVFPDSAACIVSCCLRILMTERLLLSPFKFWVESTDSAGFWGLIYKR